MNRRYVLFVALLLLLGAGSAGAGPWAPGKSHWYANLSFENLQTTRLATPAGNVEDIPELQLRQIGFYGTYGITDRFTAVLDRLGYRYTSIEDFDSASGIEDLRAGLQVQLKQSWPWIIAVRGILQTPTGDETKGLGLLPTGSGAWESDFLFSFGRSSAGGRVYGYGEVGHRVRGAALRDSFLYEAQFGAWAASKVLLIFDLRGVQPYRSQPGEDSLPNPSGLGDGVTYTVINPSVLINLTQGWGLQVEAERPFNAKNLAVGWKFRIKIFIER